MDDLSTIRTEALGAVEQAADLAALDAARVSALGKKGTVTGLMKTLGSLAPEQRREFGARVDQLGINAKAIARAPTMSGTKYTPIASITGTPNRNIIVVPWTVKIWL